MIVVGLTGGMGQGKSTVGEMLRQRAGVDHKGDLETSYPISGVVNAWIETWPTPLVLAQNQSLVQLANQLITTLPAVLERLTGKAAEVARLVIDPNDPASLEQHNRLLKYLDQWLKLSDDERAEKLPLPITPDNKALHRQILQWMGGVMIELVSETIWCDLIDRRIQQLADRGYRLVTVGGIRYPQDAAVIHKHSGVVLRVERPNAAHSSDVTETSMTQIAPDVTVYNDGSLPQLESLVTDLWHDLETATPQPHYWASKSA